MENGEKKIEKIGEKKGIKPSNLRYQTSTPNQYAAPSFMNVLGIILFIQLQSIF